MLTIFRNDPKVGRWAINGNPGIGKSVFAHLIMSVILRQGKRVVYHVQDVYHVHDEDPVSLQRDTEPYAIAPNKLSRELLDDATV
jgi:ABC-type glutathione transport system ATPase component